MMKMKSIKNWLPFLLVAFLLVPQSEAVFAQTRSHVVTIRDGRVFIDGKRVDEKDLPSSLKIEDMNLSWNFTGDALLELRGKTYELKNGKLVEADDDIARDGRVVVFFRDPEDEGEYVRVLSRTDGLPFRVNSDGRYGVVMENYYDALRNKARQFEQIRGQIAGQNTEQARVWAEQLRLEAENAARIAKAFPRVEFESYLEGIHEKDSNLYNQLVLENNIETETHRLAMEARVAQDQQQRQRIVEELRNKLNRAFELKQVNRQKEIEQLAQRLEELRQKLDQRANLRDRIIESRLRELLGDLVW